MSSPLKVSIGQYSDKGRKAINQDYFGARVPKQPLQGTKGIAIALADGISSSEVSQIASQTAVNGFLEDYYCTSDAWTVKTSAQRVLNATNSWLYAQTRRSQFRYERDKGYVCTFSALIIKSNTAHLFHIGDARIFRLRGKQLEQLTEDHRLWVSQNTSYLNRALGISQQLEIDYRALQLDKGDIFVLATDGVYEHVDGTCIANAVRDYAHDLDAAAKFIVNTALERDSQDNLTVQIVCIDGLPEQSAEERYKTLIEKPSPPPLSARMSFDGYVILRELHISPRSHVYLARDDKTGQEVALKVPSVDLGRDPAYLERFLTEEWIAGRINNAHVLKAHPTARQRNYIYTVTEYVEGQTLAQWMIDHPKPDIETVRGIVEQIANGVTAFHRLEMLHQDLRPNNIMIDRGGVVKIIDFGSTRVAGLMELAGQSINEEILGTAQYTAPEYFLGEGGTNRSDLFSLGVIAHQMLSGELPYGTQVAKTRTRAAQRKLQYRSVLDDNRAIPVWIDETLKKAVHPDPEKRYQELSEFVYDLRHPNPQYLQKNRPPLLERNPVAVWKGISATLMLVIVFLLYKLGGH